MVVTTFLLTPLSSLGPDIGCGAGGSWVRAGVRAAVWAVRTVVEVAGTAGAGIHYLLVVDYLQISIAMSLQMLSLCCLTTSSKNFIASV